MHAKQRPHRAQPGRSARAEVSTIFEVDEYGALRQRGVPYPKTHADLYPEVDPSDIRQAVDAVELIDRHPGLAARVQQLIQDELDDIQQALGQFPPGSPAATMVQDRVDALAERVDDCGAWVKDLLPHQLGPIRRQVEDWLRSPIDWTACEMPMYAGPTGEALAHFEGLPSDLLEELGVRLVHGDHPGSSYSAAELTGDLERANAVATENGLDFRFMREGESEQEDDHQAEGVPTLGAPEPPDQIRECEPELAGTAPMPEMPRLIQRHLAGFAPLFGAPPSIAWMNHVYVHDAVPAPELRHLHFTWLFQMAWRRIVETIRDPAQTWIDVEGRRHVHVLRSAIYTTEADGLMEGRIWRPRANESAVLDLGSPWAMTVDAVPWRWRWLEHWQQAFELEVAALAEGEKVDVVPAEVQAYARWAFALFRGRIRRGCDLRVMRQRIARAMALDPLALAVARQLGMVQRRSPVTMATYNRVMQRLAAHRQLEHDAPRLHLSYALLCHTDDDQVRHEPQGDEPLQRLRRLVKAHGLSSRVYRHLLQGGPAIWRPMVRFYARADAGAAWDYLGLIDDMGWKGLPDATFMQQLLAQCGSADKRRTRYAALCQREMRVLRRLVQRYEGLDTSGRAAMRETLPQVLTWLGQDEAQRVREAARVPAWTTLLKQAQVFERERLRLAESDGWPWPAIRLEGAADDPTYEVMLLTSAQALRDEGRAMRHCALSYARACAAGSAAVASVRDRKTGRRVATVLWKRDEQGWSLAEVVGFANGPATCRARKPLHSLRVVDLGASKSPNEAKTRARLRL